MRNRFALATIVFLNLNSKAKRLYAVICKSFENFGRKVGWSVLPRNLEASLNQLRAIANRGTIRHWIKEAASLFAIDASPSKATKYFA